MYKIQDCKIVEQHYFWRVNNNIKGKTYILNCKLPDGFENHWFLPGILRPCTVCLHTTKKYYMHQECTSWSILLITDDRKRFEKVTKDEMEKEKFRELTCWDVLQELQREGGKYYEIE